MNNHKTHITPGKAQARYLWLSPSKIRRIVPYLQKRSVSEAMGILRHVTNCGSVHLQKLIKSASANYLQTFPHVDPDTIRIKELYVDDGPRVKRIWRRGRGRADILLKRMCHVTAVVESGKFASFYSRRPNRNRVNARSSNSDNIPVPINAQRTSSLPKQTTKQLNRKHDENADKKDTRNIVG